MADELDQMNKKEDSFEPKVKFLHKEVDSAISNHRNDSSSILLYKPKFQQFFLLHFKGTNKRKELHQMTDIHALSGTWAHEPDDITLNAYGLDFVCDQEGENYNGFILLLDAFLDDDVANTELELYLIPDKTVKSSMTPRGRIKLSAIQVEKSKLFQEFFFNGIFGKLFTGSKSTGVQREFLLKEGKRVPWSSTSMYLPLPLELSSFANHNTTCIHWKGIEACTSVIKFLRSAYSANGEYYPKPTRVCIPNSNDVIHMANTSLRAQDISESIVLAVHTGRLYSVLDVVTDLTSKSLFDEIHDAKKSQFSSFVDYYHEKYNIALQHPGQPLLLLKQSHNPHNLLISRSKFKGLNLKDPRHFGILTQPKGIRSRSRTIKYGSKNHKISKGIRAPHAFLK